MKRPNMGEERVKRLRKTAVMSYIDSPYSCCWKDQKDKPAATRLLRKTLPFFYCFVTTLCTAHAAGALERVSNADNFSQTRGGHGKYVVA